MNITEIIANKVKEKRIEAGLSQVSLANKAGITSRTIQKIEQGLPCSTTTLQSIFYILNINMILK